MTEMFDYTFASVVLAIINIILLGMALTIFLQNLRTIKSYITIGLVIVAVMLLIQNILIIGFWQTLYMESSQFMMTIDMISQYLFVINLMQTIGLSVLVWITRR